MKKGVSRKFTKFTRTHSRQSLFFNKVVGRLATLLKKKHWHGCFRVNFVKFLKTPFLQNTSGRLLLDRKNWNYAQNSEICKAKIDMIEWSWCKEKMVSQITGSLKTSDWWWVVINGAAPKILPFSDDFNEILSTRDILNITSFEEVRQL